MSEDFYGDAGTEVVVANKIMKKFIERGNLMQRVLILGASGLVGRALVDEFKESFDVYGTYSSSPVKLPKDKQFQLELQQVNVLKEIIHSIKPNIVISSLRGDFNQQLEFHKELTLELHNSGVYVYYLSTANVFDGDYSKHHVEIDTPIAESDYGKFKINCENILKETLDNRAVIIRIPAIWGKESPRMNLIRDSIEKNQPIDVYSNLECNNLLDTQLAKQLRFIIENQLKGIFHLGAADIMSHGQFFELLVNGLSTKKSLLKFNWCDDTGNTF